MFALLGPQGVDYRYRLNEARHGPRLTGHVPDSERPQRRDCCEAIPGRSMLLRGPTEEAGVGLAEQVGGSLET